MSVIDIKERLSEKATFRGRAKRAYDEFKGIFSDWIAVLPFDDEQFVCKFKNKDGLTVSTSLCSPSPVFEDGCLKIITDYQIKLLFSSSCTHASLVMKFIDASFPASHKLIINEAVEYGQIAKALANELRDSISESHSLICDQDAIDRIKHTNFRSKKGTYIRSSEESESGFYVCDSEIENKIQIGIYRNPDSTANNVSFFECGIVADTDFFDYRTIDLKLLDSYSTKFNVIAKSLENMLKTFL